MIFASTARADYRLVLVGPSLSQSPTGEAIELTGQGTFDPELQTAHLQGGFVRLNADGNALARGQWRSVAFQRFQRFVGKDEQVGGVLEVTVDFLVGGVRTEQTRMRFVCLMHKPDEFGDDEGVSVGPFVDKTSGLVRISRK